MIIKLKTKVGRGRSRTHNLCDALFTPQFSNFGCLFRLQINLITLQDKLKLRNY
jgi:hypothetical protein